MIGFEVELDRRVSDAAGGNIAGDRKLAICAGTEFTVVTDSRSAAQVNNTKNEIDYSNIELVTQPFEQSAGLTAIAAAVERMKKFTAACYAIKSAASLDQVLKNSGLACELTAEGITAVVHPASDIIVEAKKKYRVDDKGQDNLFVHYTVGYPVGLLYNALEWITAGTRKDAEDPDERSYPIMNAHRAARAGTAAVELFRRWAQAQNSVVATQADADALKGYVALVYTQVAAMIDHADPEASGQIKNKTVAVSRVPLRAVATVLPGVVQAFLRQQAWVDMLNEYEVGPAMSDLATFIGEQFDEAQEAVDDRKDDGIDAEAAIPKLKTRITTARQKLAGINTKIANPPQNQKRADAKKLEEQRIKALKRLYKLEEDLQQQQDHFNYYQNAAVAYQQWKDVRASLPDDLRDLNTARIKNVFQWSVLNQAIVPALEGRALADNLSTASLDTLFKPALAPDDELGPDGGCNRDLETELISDLGGVDVMLGEILRSALLAPCQPPIWQTMIFGGMHELPGPDLYTHGDGRTCVLIPLELRSYGPDEITWDGLANGLTELTKHSVTLMMAALA